MTETATAWSPDAGTLENARLTSLIARLNLPSYDALLDFALARPADYWRGAMAECGIDFPFTEYVDLSRGPAFPRWFPGTAFNACMPILAWAAKEPDRPALVAEGEDGDARRLSYAETLALVRQLAGLLAAQGVRRGDRVALLMPNRVEAVGLLLACAWLGAVAVPLYSGFGPEAIRQRLGHSGARLLVTVRETVRAGRRIDMERPALAGAAELGDSCDVLFLEDARPAPPVEDPVATEAGEPLMILYTSGTSGTPKGTVHTHAGFPLRVSHDMALLFDVHPAERVFWFSDMGWMIGPMLAFAPLMLGAAAVFYEGGPAAPGVTRLLDTARRHGVTHMGVAPTLARAWRSAGVAAQELPDLRVLMSAGEILDPDLFRYLHGTVNEGRLPIVNYSGGTEVSGGLLSNVLLRPILPSGFNSIAPGVDLRIAPDGGDPDSGEMVLANVFPGMTSGLWEDEATYLETYWSARPGLWSHGDIVTRNGTHHDIVGRADDVLKLSGRRIGPSEVEAAALACHGVAEAAAVALPGADGVERLAIYIVAREGAGPRIGADTARHVEERLGKAFRPDRVYRVPMLPRTRNGKLLRKTLKALALGKVVDPSSVADPRCIEHGYPPFAPGVADPGEEGAETRGAESRRDA